MQNPAKDHLRQRLNLMLALGQIVCTFLAFGLGTDFREATRSALPPMLIEPATYAFMIWSLIYAGSVVYGLYQATKKQRENPLLRRIGWLTATGFAATCAWLFFARFNLIWGTVVCIYVMYFTLLLALLKVNASNASLTQVEKWCVLVPLAVFNGWLTIAVFANTVAALRESGIVQLGTMEIAVTLTGLIAAGIVCALLAIRLRGNLGFTLTVIWALSAITVANITRSLSLLVAVVSLCIAAFIVLISRYTKTARSR